MKKIIFKERGQALIMIALAAVVLFGLAALAIDGSILFSDRRHAQNAADTAALAAALAKTRGKDYITAGFSRATSNGYDNNGTSNVVVISTSKTDKGNCADTGMDITVTITSHVNTTFARILGWTQLTNIVTSTARACDVAGGKPLYAGSSVWSTKSGVACNGTSSENIHNGGTGNVNLYGGGLGSANADPDCVNLNGGDTQLLQNGSDCADITTAASSAPKLGGVGGTCSSSPNTNATFSDPPADLGITCNGNATVSGNTMSPGNYTGSFPPANVTTLKPGTYCIWAGNQNFKLNGGDTLTGTGVTIVMNSGSIDWGGNSSVQLTAPTTGNYKGLLIYYPPGNSDPVYMQGTGDNTFTGTVLAQNSQCRYAGTSNVNKQTIQFICNTWESTGTADLNIVYDSSLFFEPVIPPAVSQLY